MYFVADTDIFFLLQMVTDLIKIPCVRNLVFRDHLQSYPESIVNVTLHNVIITHKQTDGNYKELWVRYGDRNDLKSPREFFARYSIQIWMLYNQNFQ
jgi:hypothetical protein